MFGTRRFLTTLMGLALLFSVGCEKPSESKPIETEPAKPAATQPVSSSNPTESNAETESAPIDSGGQGAAESHDEQMRDLDIPASQRELLILADQVATAMPINPHVKDRSAAQQSVVEAALELGQPALAEKFLYNISNYRQGVAFADLAYYLAENDMPGLADDYAKRAMRVESLDGITEWRKSRIRVGVARVRALLGDNEAIAQLTQAVDPNQLGMIDITLSEVVETEEQIDMQIARLDALILTDKHGSYCECDRRVHCIVRSLLP